MSLHEDPTRAARAADLRRWRAQFGDCTAIGDAAPRHCVDCVGVVRAIRLVPGRALEITVEDGSGRLKAVFTGRSRLPGLEMGSGLRLTGTVIDDGHGHREIRNPEWSLVSEPYS